MTGVAPDFVLGERGEYVTTDFDGHVRECFVIGQEIVPCSDTDGGGVFVWVRVEPPFPVRGGEPVGELVLCGRYDGRELNGLGDGPLTVNVFIISRPSPDGEFPARRSLRLEATGQVARKPSMLDMSREEEFERTFTLLERFVAREGHADVPHDHHEEGVNVGNWVMYARYSHATGRDRPEWSERLGKLPGWVWLSGDDIFLVGQYARREGHTDMPIDHREEGRPVGEFARRWRQDHRRGWVAPSEQEALEAIPGWHW